MKLTRKRYWLAGIIAVCLVCVIVLLCFNLQVQGSELKYKVNENGETYGKQIPGSEEEPDLIACTATNGKDGYVKQTDMDKYGGGNVKSPEEAKEYMNSCEDIIKIPVYKSDGKSVIGYFELEGTSVEVEASEPEDTSNINDNIEFSSTTKGKAKSIKGYKYSYKAFSGIWGSKGWASIKQDGYTNVPIGYMGAKAVIYDSSGNLKASSSWQYNNKSCNEINVYTKSLTKNNKYYYGQGKARAYNGNGYNTYTLYKSPNAKLTSSEDDAYYEVNENGETYGLGIYESIIGEEPDLIAAIGIDGTFGYVKSSDFEIDNDNNKEAAAMSISDKETSIKFINLYDSEGNAIGKFKVETHIELEETEPESI